MELDDYVLEYAYANSARHVREAVGLVYKGYTVTTTLDRSFGVVVVCQKQYIP